MVKVAARQHSRAGVKVPAVERAFRVLRALQDGGTGRRLSDLSQDLGLSMSTLSELLATLDELRVVERDPVSRAFRLGPALVELGLAARRNLHLTRAAHHHLEWLREMTGETAILHLPNWPGAVIIDAVESHHQLKAVAPLGHRLPAFAGSVGKVLLAAAAEDDLQMALGQGPLRAFTDRSITDPDSYRAELQRVRQQGYATDDEEYLLGVRAVSAPVRDVEGGVVAVITVVGAGSRVPRGQLRSLAGQVTAAAAGVSARLGAEALTTVEAGTTR